MCSHLSGNVLCSLQNSQRGNGWKMITKNSVFGLWNEQGEYADPAVRPPGALIITNKTKTSHKIWKWFWCLRLYHKCLHVTNIHGKPYMARSWRMSCRNLRWTFLVNNGWQPYLTTFKNWLSRDSLLTCALGGLSPVLCPHYPDGSSPGEEKKIWRTLKTIDIK